MFKNPLFEVVGLMKEKIQKLETRLDKVEAENARLKLFQNILILKMANNLPVDPDLIYQKIPYQDFTPEEAKKIINDPNQSYQLIDVSALSSTRTHNLKTILHIPLQELEIRQNEILPKTRRILVISEDGTQSILACEMLIRLGFYLVYNISGGYKFLQFLDL